MPSVTTSSVSGEIGLDAPGRPIPPAETHPLPVDADLASRQLAAKQVVEHDGDHSALAPRGVLRIPPSPRVGVCVFSG
jgi:hypothetical protein